MATLVNNCGLVTALVNLLNKNGGSVSYHRIGGDLLYLKKGELQLVKGLLAGLLEGDIRFALLDETLELLPDPCESRLLSETPFVVVDVETTGARARRDRVTEIAAYKIVGGEIVDEFVSLINPQHYIPKFISNLTGITNEMVAGAPRFADCCATFTEFIGDAVFVAHNAPFDWRFINGEIERVTGRGLPNAQLCTVQMSRRLVPGLDNYRLHTVAEYYSIEIIDRHRAGGDALATAKIFLRFLGLLKEFGVPDLATARRFKLPVNEVMN